MDKILHMLNFFPYIFKHLSTLGLFWTYPLTKKKLKNIYRDYLKPSVKYFYDFYFRNSLTSYTATDPK